MSGNSVVRPRIDAATKAEAAAEKALPFEPLVPNAETNRGHEGGAGSWLPPVSLMLCWRA
jgi:antitoxin component of RelBE/YafQ-DinJ toxin-antitoxin module